MRYCLTFFLAFLHLAKSQIPFPGACPKVKLVETFDLDKYMGTWYEYSKYPFIFEAGRKCTQAVYKDLGNGTISVVNSGVFVIVNKPHSTKGSAKVIAPGQLAVSFRQRKADKANYLILDTDYDNYAVVHSCTNLTSYAHTELLWILTRERQPSPESIQIAEKVVEVNNLSDVFLVKSTQTNCPDKIESNSEDDQTTAASSSNAGDENSSTTTERVIDSA